MRLIDPSPEFSESFSDALKEFEEKKIKGFWNHGGPITDIPAYIDRVFQYSKGINLPEGWVPSSTLWMIDDDVFVAHVNIRHRLNDYLEKIGGHIGYAVRPSMQGKGYGSKILELALPKAGELGIDKALLTCDVSNIASRKIIEKNGGELQREILAHDEPVLQFLIDVSKRKAD